MALILTSKGLLPEESLRCREIRTVIIENGLTIEETVAVEHWDGDELVKRGAHVHLPQGFPALSLEMEPI